MMPSRLPLNVHTLTRILAQCKTSTARRRVIQREIAIIKAGREWGMLSRWQSLECLDRLNWALNDKRQSWNRPAFGARFPDRGITGES